MISHNSIPRVSIIMNCYNSAKFLREAIDSVLAQTYTNWEIIFWDNQSTDDSAEIFNSYVDDRMKYFYSPQHTNLGEARNLAFEKVLGEWCGILDCDDIWLPLKLELQLLAINSNEKAGVIYSDYNYITASGAVKKDSGKMLDGSVGDVFNAMFVDKFTPCWPTVLLNSAALRKAGSFKGFKYLEDFDVLLKLAETHQYIYVDKKLANYRVHSNQSSANYRAMLEEKLQIIYNWQIKWTEEVSLSKERLKLLAQARGKAYFIAGNNAIFSGDSGVKYYIKSIRENLTAQSFAGFILSLFGSKFASLIIVWIRRRLGYRTYWLESSGD